jgi:hypothetical protein
MVTSLGPSPDLGDVQPSWGRWGKRTTSPSSQPVVFQLPLALLL